MEAGHRDGATYSQRVALPWGRSGQDGPPAGGREEQGRREEGVNERDGGYQAGLDGAAGSGEGRAEGGGAGISGA